MDEHVVLRLKADAQNNLTRPCIGLPQWPQTCEVFFFEGRALLHTMFDFTFGSCQPPMDQTTNAKLQMIRPSILRILTMCTKNLHASDEVVGACFKLSETGLRAIEHVLEHIVEKDANGLKALSPANLRSLRVRAAFVNFCMVCQRYKRRLQVDVDELWCLDLEFLEAFGLSLDAFEFEVTDVDTELDQDGYIHGANCWIRVERAFGTEVKRVGGILTRDPNSSFSMNTLASARPKAVIFRSERRPSKNSGSSTTFEDETFVEAPTKLKEAVFQRTKE